MDLNRLDQLGEPDLNDLVRRLGPKVKDNWQIIAILLDIDVVDVASVRNNSFVNRNPILCLLEILNIWKRKMDDRRPYSWRTVIEILKDPLMGNDCALSLELYNQLVPASQDNDIPSLVTMRNYLGHEGIDEQETGQSQGDSSETSDYNNSNQSLPDFVCCCGECTIKDYLQNGCKEAGKLRDYPKLNVRDLTRVEQESLLSKLDRELGTVQKEFAVLTNAVLKWLLSNQIDVKQLIMFVDGMTTFTSTKANCKSKHLYDVQEELNSCDSIIDLFFLLKNYWSWMNYDLLEEIVFQFCDDSIQCRFITYEKETLGPFLKRSIIEIPSCAYGHQNIQNYENLVFKLGTDMESHSADSLRLIRDKLCRILEVDPKALHIAMVTDGCIEITFVVPSNIFDEVFPLSKDAQLQLAGLEVDGNVLHVEKVISSKYEYSMCSASGLSLPQTARIQLPEIPEDVLNMTRQQSSQSSEEIISVPPSFLPNNISTAANFTRSSPLYDLNYKNTVSEDDTESNSSTVTKYSPSSGYQSDKDSNFEGKEIFGIHQVCKMCFELNDRERRLNEDQCLGLDDTHASADWVHVAWDKSQKWMKIRNKPDHAPIAGYSLCSSKDCCKEKCPFAHSKLELKAWKYEHQKQQLPINKKSVVPVKPHESYPHIQSSVGLSAIQKRKSITSSRAQSEKRVHIPMGGNKQIIRSNQPQPLTFIQDQQPYFGVLPVCKLCFQNDIFCKAGHCAQHIQPAGNADVECYVTWDNQWIEIRKRPTFSPEDDKGYAMCSSDENCHEDDCTFAHTRIEQKAWNFELRKQRQIPKPLIFAPGQDSSLPDENRSWKVEFFKRLKNSKVNRVQLQYPLNERTYRKKFYHLLCFEEMEHINKLTQLCDGKYQLHIYEERPSFSISEANDREQINADDIHKGTDVSIGHYSETQAEKNVKIVKDCTDASINKDSLHSEKKNNDLVYGFLHGSSLKSNIIEYATQASEAIFFVTFDENSRKRDICKIHIHPHNFVTTEEKLFVFFSSTQLRGLKSMFKLNNGVFVVDVEFEVKHYYFNTLHYATDKLPDFVIIKLLPSSNDDFETFSLDYFDWRKTSDVFPFLHLDYKSQLPSLKRIISCPSKVPFILSGPFGSGKTRILACAAFYFATSCADQQAKFCAPKILICAHHQRSTETFIQTYFGKVFEKNPTLELQVIHIIRGKANSKTYNRYSRFYKTISKFKEWINSSYDASKPIIIISTYMNSLSLFEILQVPGFGFFTHFLLDEAAQVREPEAIAPLSLATRDAKIVLAGDHFQVGPDTLVLGHTAISNGLNISLLQRLLELYQGCQSLQQYFTCLNVIYRCSASLLPIPEKLFYGPLHPGKRNYRIHLGPQGYSFISSNSTLLPSHPRMEKNEEEALILVEEVLSYVEYMKHEKVDTYFTPYQVAVISASRIQLNLIKEFIFGDDRYKPIRSVKFLPSYIIQGYEFKAIFLSLCGSLLGGEVFHHTKSLCNPLVFNTVITRATTKVVAVGNPFELLEYESSITANHDSIRKPWTEYLQLCIKNESINITPLEKQRLAKLLDVSVLT